jgi:hypothetical protein
MTRRVLALVLLVLLGGFGGCLSPGGPIDSERLDRTPPAPYAWSTEAAVHVTVHGDDRVQVVVSPVERELRLAFDDEVAGERSVPIGAVRAERADGTVLTGSQLREAGATIAETREATTIRVAPDADITAVGFTMDSRRNQLLLPAVRDGAHVVVLPAGRQVDLPVIGQVRPGADAEVQTADGRVELRWDQLEARPISVRYYQDRDLVLFGGVIAIAAGVLVGGLVYFRREVLQLRRRREGVDERRRR